MKCLLIILILFAIVLLSIINPKYETFLIDDIKKILDTNPPCLLTDEQKALGGNYCSNLSKNICNKTEGNCNDCEWSNNKCIRKHYTKKNNLFDVFSDYPKQIEYCRITPDKCPSNCKSKDGWPLTEHNCYECKNCGWCIYEDENINKEKIETGVCIKPDCNNTNCRPSKCTKAWEYRCFDYGELSD